MVCVVECINEGGICSQSFLENLREFVVAQLKLFSLLHSTVNSRLLYAKHSVVGTKRQA